MTAEPPFLLLDVSRLVSRIGLGPLTGIDRVEAAWLEALRTRPHALLCRVPRRQLLLPPSAGPAILEWLASPSSVPVPRGLVARLRRARTPRARAEEVLAGMAEARGTASGLGLNLRRRLPPGTWSLNLGHANLAPGPWRALRGLRRAVMIHDTIPLDHPEWTRDGQDAAFRDKLVAAFLHADLLLTVSEASRRDLLRWRARLSPARQVPVTPVPLARVAPVAGQLPAGFPADRPWFAALGTIEPRKNHALLLDVWARLARGMRPEALPRLVILGRRGWRNRDLFSRLDALPAEAMIVERAGDDDASVAAILAGAQGLLMPSRAEGFGLPLVEAARLGLPVIATPLPAAQEALADYPATWLGPDDVEGWAGAVASLAAGPTLRHPPLAARDWNAHVSEALHLLAETVT